MKTIRVSQRGKEVIFIVFLTALCMNLNAQNMLPFTQSEKVTLEIMSLKEKITVNSKQEIKHSYSYDKNGNVKERETFYWENRHKEWRPYFRMSFSYKEDETTIELAYWNWNTQKFDLDRQQTSYIIDRSNNTLNYKRFQWNEEDQSWTSK